MVYGKAHRVLCVGVFIAGLSCAIYAKPQAFMNLWLTRDQQAMLSFNQGETAKAARTFADKNWAAYSFYADGDFAQAASLYAQFDTVDAKFSEANAFAHASQFRQAAELYQEVLDLEPQHQKALGNLALIKELIKKMKDAPRKKSSSSEIADKQKLRNTDKKVQPKSKVSMPSNALWLKQVQQNPSKFLRKKFQQEYINAQK